MRGFLLSLGIIDLYSSGLKISGSDWKHGGENLQKKRESSNPSGINFQNLISIIPLSFVVFLSGCVKQPSSNQTGTAKIEQKEAVAFLSVCERTEQVQKAILEALAKTECSEVTKKELSSLLVLKINKKKLKELKSGDFSGLSSLHQLFLSVNDLNHLPVDIFSGLNSLRELDLSWNKLNHLPKGIFSGLSLLQTLNLSANDLKTLPPGLFFDLNFLQALFLSYNELRNLPPKLFSNLISLKKLYLVKNQLTFADKNHIKSQLKPYGTDIRF